MFSHMFMPWQYLPYTELEPKTHRQVLCGINAQYLSFRLDKTTCPWCLDIVKHMQDHELVSLKGDTSLGYKLKTPETIHLGYMPKDNLFCTVFACKADRWAFGVRQSTNLRKINCFDCFVYSDKLVEDGIIEFDRNGEVVVK